MCLLFEGHHFTQAERFHDDSADSIHFSDTHGAVVERSAWRHHSPVLFRHTTRQLNDEGRDDDEQSGSRGRMIVSSISQFCPSARDIAEGGAMGTAHSYCDFVHGLVPASFPLAPPPPPRSLNEEAAERMIFSRKHASLLQKQAQQLQQQTASAASSIVGTSSSSSSSDSPDSLSHHSDYQQTLSSSISSSPLTPRLSSSHGPALIPPTTAPPYSSSFSSPPISPPFRSPRLSHHSAGLTAATSSRAAAGCLLLGSES